MKQKISCLISRIMSKQSATQRSYLSSFASLLTLLLIGCCTISFASQNISNPNTNRELRGQSFDKKADFINDCVSQQNNSIQSWIECRKKFLDLGLSVDNIDDRIKEAVGVLKIFKDYQTFYFDKEGKYEKFIYSHELVEKEGS